MEQTNVVGIAHDSAVGEVTVRSLPGGPARLFEALGAAGVVVDLIVQSVPRDGSADVSFTVPLDQLATAVSAARSAAAALGAGNVEVEERVASVSLVGSGMASHPGVAAEVFSVLSDAAIDIRAVSTSPIRLTCVIREQDVEKAVRRLHDAFDPPIPVVEP